MLYKAARHVRNLNKLVTDLLIVVFQDQPKQQRSLLCSPRLRNAKRYPLKPVGQSAGFVKMFCTRHGAWGKIPMCGFTNGEKSIKILPCWKLKHMNCVQNVLRQSGHALSGSVEITSLASSPWSQKKSDKNHQHCARSSKELHKKAIQLEVEKNWNPRASWYIYMTSIWPIGFCQFAIGLEILKNMPVCS